MIHQSCDTLEEMPHSFIVCRHLPVYLSLPFCRGDIPQEYDRILRLLTISTENVIPRPVLLTMYSDATFQTQLPVTLTKPSGYISSVVEPGNLMPELLAHVIVYKCRYKFIPCIAALKDGHKRRLNLHGVKCILLKIHVILTQIGLRKGIVESSCPLLLHLQILLHVNIDKCTCYPAGCAICTPYHLCLCTEPLIISIQHPQPVLHIVFICICLISDHSLQAVQYPVLIGRMKQSCP